MELLEGGTNFIHVCYQYSLVVYLPLFTVYHLNTDEKLHRLVHPWKYFSFIQIINKNSVLEDIHLI